ncbi:hypothetical protein RI129_000314 [Pyrocoelia pectoralis]|uniref:Carboxylic ester hydrolase n=1 Tax=Pyrocoelia pectoralis TaxID=417401 RepID=A0AAN7VI33_9COLE
MVHQLGCLWILELRELSLYNFLVKYLTRLPFKGSFANDGPLVQTSLGKIIGFYRSSFEGRVFSAFEGIPYARPPVGDLRFEPPQPALPWNEVLNANTQHICKQDETPFMPLGNPGSEDCLYLNVYVPKAKLSEHDNYDVIVNIHGGGFMIGASSFAGPRYFMDRDVIYVNLNYRLGILGFLSTEDDIVPGNNGLKDQQLALNWVQTHIKQFGGNPKSVTLMGSSAGAASVHYHYFSPKSKGLFHRGISQSGTVLMPWAVQKGALQKTKKLALSLNCQGSDTRTIIKCLKAIPVDEIINKTKDFNDLGLIPLVPSFAPVVEVESKFPFLTKHPYKQLEDGEVYDIPWLTWITKDEGIFMVMYLINILDQVENYWDEWSDYLFDYKYVCPEASKKEISGKIKSFYFKNEKITQDNVKSLIKALTDRFFTVGFETTIQMQAKVTNSHVYAAVYGYNKSDSIGKTMGIELDGVPHGADAFIMHDMSMPVISKMQLSDSDILMKNVLIDFVTSFANNGKPQSGEVDWKPITSNHPKYLLINDFNDTTMTEIPKSSPTEFWTSLNFLENNRAERLREEL